MCLFEIFIFYSNKRQVTKVWKSQHSSASRCLVETQECKEDPAPNRPLLLALCGRVPEYVAGIEYQSYFPDREVALSRCFDWNVDVSEAWKVLLEWNLRILSQEKALCNRHLCLAERRSQGIRSAEYDWVDSIRGHQGGEPVLLPFFDLISRWVRKRKEWELVLISKTSGVTHFILLWIDNFQTKEGRWKKKRLAFDLVVFVLKPKSNESWLIRRDKEKKKTKRRPGNINNRALAYLHSGCIYLSE